MKKRSLLLTTMFLMVTLMTCAQNYWIEGFYERHGAGNYTLKDVNTNGVKIDGKTKLTQTLHGNKMHIKCDGVDATMVQFAFENVDIECDNPDITFQYWSEDINDWKTDVEACKYESAGYSQKDMVMILVLDYSNSMSKNIKRMQDMAYNFIKNAASYSNSNIHIGIVAFSGMDITDRQVLEITPLRKENLSKFERFIKTEAQPGMETALYYAFDKAMDMIERYVDIHNFNEDNYNGSCMVTFTDGLDNASINDNISKRMQRGSKNEYLAYLNEIVHEGSQQKIILGLPVESYAVGFSGSEKFTDDDLTLFRLVLQKLATDEDHFILSDDFAIVEKFFNHIFEQLTSRWKTLNLYIGEAQYGKVRWVLNCGKPQRVDTPKPLPPVKTKKVRFNVNIGLTTIDVIRKGYPISGAYNLTLSNDSNAPMGAYLGVSWDMSFKKGLGIEFGDIGFAYYHSSTTNYITLGFDSLHDSWTWGDGVLDEYYYGYITATSVNLYASPIKIQYRYETPSSFAVFAVTGPAIDYLVDYSVKIQIIENGDHLILSNIFNPICFYWDIKGGVAYRFIKLTAGTSLRMNNVSKDSDYTAKIGRPFYLMFSFVF